MTTRRAIWICLAPLVVLVAGPPARGGEREGCGAGERPVVELLAPTWAGGVPEVLRRHELVFTEDFWRVWAWGEIQRAWPCTELKLGFSDPYRDRVQQLGSERPAGYAVRGRVFVDDSLREAPILRLGGWNGIERTVRRQVLAPAHARISIRLELFSKETGEGYGEGLFTVDWVDDPPGDDIFAPSDAPLARVGDRLLEPADAIFWEGWTPEPLAGHLPLMRGGDPGRIVRERETPDAARVSGEGQDLRVLLFDAGDRPLAEGSAVVIATQAGGLGTAESGLGSVVERVARVRGGAIDAASLGYSPPGCERDGIDLIRVSPPSGSGGAEVSVVDLRCHDAWAEIVARTERRRHETDAPGDDRRRVESVDLDEEREARFVLLLNPIPDVDALPDGRERRSFRVRRVVLADEHLFLRRQERSTALVDGVPRREALCRRTLRGRAGSPERVAGKGETRFVVVADAATGRILEVRPPRWASRVVWSGRSICRAMDFVGEDGASGRWHETVHIGLAESEGLLTTWPDGVVIEGLQDHPDCFVPAAVSPLVRGGCEAREFRDGVELETGYEWSIRLPSL